MGSFLQIIQVRGISPSREFCSSSEGIITLAHCRPVMHSKCRRDTIWRALVQYENFSKWSAIVRTLIQKLITGSTWEYSIIITINIGKLYLSGRPCISAEHRIVNHILYRRFKVSSCALQQTSFIKSNMDECVVKIHSRYSRSVFWCRQSNLHLSVVNVLSYLLNVYSAEAIITLLCREIVKFFPNVYIF